MAGKWSPDTYIIPTKNSSGYIKLDLTEENLNYLLRQEYLLSQIYYNSDQLSLEVLEKTRGLQALKNKEQRDSRNGEDILSGQEVAVKEEYLKNRIEINTNMSNQKIIVKIGDQNNIDSVKVLILKSVGELLKVGMDGSEFITLYNFSQSKYSCNFEYVLTEKLNRTKKNALERRSPLAEKNSIFFKIKSLISTSRVYRNPKTLILNSSTSRKMFIKNQWQTCNCTNSFISRPHERETKKMHYGDGINSSPLKERKTLGITMSSPSDCNPLPKDLILTSSFQDIGCIDAHLKGLNSPVSEANCSKSKVIQAGFNDIITTFTGSTNFHMCNFEGIISVKSNLKRKITVQANDKKTKLKKSMLKFANITIFYFERSQGFSSVPTKGGCTLGMVSQHFYISTVPLEEYEHKKSQRCQPKLRIHDVVSYRQFYSKEKSKNVQALTLNQRIELLECAKVNIELKEEDDCAYIRASRASAGCDCRNYCDPDICDCSLAGIECQVDRPNFPCGCSRDNCQNKMGRNEYNHNRVKTHFIKTIRKIKSENKGRTSKRKQASPSKVLIKSSDIKTSGEIMHI